ncbi:MAG: hypothetical protein HN704_08480 [Bacteroidetes bacterium]|nr:hypothetical protein [Bacteroidota bacterium]MBT6686394.1 hypothetical protein [Bacteroidota bacterium]MBT7142227.1 hypothetical protein [Bacteroidota bacterium]MBT7491629.1 hypothetical protein [Bacteroidota bacterium]
MKCLNNKTIIAILVLLLNFTFIFNVAAQVQTIQYQDSWATQGFSIKQESSASAIVSFSINEFFLEDFIVAGDSMQKLQLPGSFLPNNEGAPDIPGNGRYIAIPENSNASINIISMRIDTLENIDLLPAQRIPLVTDNNPVEYIKDNSIYEDNSFYPKKNIQLSEKKKIRAVDVVMLGITPFQYNPVSKRLLIYRDIVVEVSFHGGNGQFGNNRYRNRWFEPILSSHILNYNSLPPIDFSSQISYSTNTTQDFEYLIIAPDDAAFLSWADSIKNWRIQQGIKTGIITTTQIGGNSTTLIENYINNAYNNWTIPPVAVLLLGDYGTTGSTIISPEYNSYCASDNIYADVDGDNLPDIAFARITAQNSTHLATMVGKFLDYERQPPISNSYYKNPLIAGGWQSDRWFIMCTEILYGFLENELGKTPVREYSGTSSAPASWSTNSNTGMVVNYFGPNGLSYIPNLPSYLTDWTGDAAGINAAINNGAFITQHRDHGGTTGWGDPSYHNSDLSNLYNIDPTFVFSINCQTGAFDASSECFAEAFHRHQYGALGIIAATANSYSFVNDAFVWGMYDYMWPDFDPGYGYTGEHTLMPCFANMSGKYYLQASAFPYNSSSKAVTYHLFHHHGDAFTTVYSEVPQSLTVSHDLALYSGVTFFTVTANPGATIALTRNDEILAVAEGTGLPLAISISPQIPGGDLRITVTKQNFYRYSESVIIIPPAGPYITYESYLINDNFGNADGNADFDELILLKVDVKNVGLDSANSVNCTLSSSDNYINILDSLEFYGTISANSTVGITDAFAFQISDSVPNEHIINFEIIATNPDSTWTSSFSISANAPELNIGNIVVSDANGNSNGALDPGETVDIIVPIANIGNSNALNTTCTLSSSSIDINIVSSSVIFTNLAALQTVNAVFSVSVNQNAIIPTIVNFQANVNSGNYSHQKDFAKSIGLIFENWETSNLNQFFWQTGGDLPWFITLNQSYDGLYSIQSGDISDSQSSEFELSVYVLTSDSISFFRKVSSETSYDYLEFYIDNIMLDHWAGELSWENVSFPISSGYHTLKWVYDKDGSVSTGSDCAYVDYIVFPPIVVPDIDIGVTAVNSPISYISLGSNEIVEVEIKNFGSNPVSNFDINYLVNNSTVVTELVDTVILSGNTLTYTFNTTADLSAIGQYDFKVFTNLPTDTFHFNDTIFYSVENIPLTYCQPTANCSYGDGIEDFELDSINHSTGCSTNGYGDYTNLSTSLITGQTYTINVTTGYANQYLSLWVDFNNNYLFEASELLITDFYLSLSNTNYSTSLTVPMLVTSGSHRMRVRVNYAASSADPCATFTYGETHDYTVEIVSSVNPLLVNAGIDKDICMGDSAVLSASVFGGNPPYYYSWSNNDTLPSTIVMPNTSTTYYVTVTDSLGNTEIDDIMITVNPLPTVFIGADTSLVLGQTLTLNAGLGFSSYIWNTGHQSQNISANATGNYSVTITDINGCLNFDDINITFSPAISPAWTYEVTGENHTILIPQNTSIIINNSPIAVGDYIGVFYDSLGTLLCGGYTQWLGTTTSIAAWGEDVGNDGFENGEIFNWRIWDASEAMEYGASAIYNTSMFPNSEAYVPNGMSGIDSLKVLLPDWTYSVTGTNHTILIPDNTNINISGVSISPGSFLGVFYDSIGTLVCGGYTIWEGSTTSLAAWGEDVGNDGFAIGEEFNWKVWEVSNGQEYDATATYNTVIFPNNSMFMVNGMSGIAELVSLNFQNQQIQLSQGWNIFSTYIQSSYQIADSIFSSIASDVIIVKNGLGLVYWPLYNINNIGELIIGDGYQIKMSNSNILTISGSMIFPESFPINLLQGWNLVAYLRLQAAPIESMLNSISSNIIIVKNETGLVYWPAWGVNNIGNMEPGEGYQIKLSSNSILLYPANN